jgi:hypothetical protein
MAGLVPAIHVCLAAKKDVDARDERGHDDSRLQAHARIATIFAEPNTRGTRPGHDERNDSM